MHAISKQFTMYSMICGSLINPMRMRRRVTVVSVCVCVCVCVCVASYPGLPMFFNVSREKSGRPGRFYYVVMTYWTRFGPRLAISAYSPTQYSTRRAASQRHSGGMWLARAFESRELSTKRL